VSKRTDVIRLPNFRTLINPEHIYVVKITNIATAACNFDVMFDNFKDSAGLLLKLSSKISR
jgi:hypothetical protein